LSNNIWDSWKYSCPPQVTLRGRRLGAAGGEVGVAAGVEWRPAHWAPHLRSPQFAMQATGASNNFLPPSAARFCCLSCGSRSSSQSARFRDFLVRRRVRRRQETRAVSALQRTWLASPSHVARAVGRGTSPGAASAAGRQPCGRPCVLLDWGAVQSNHLIMCRFSCHKLNLFAVELRVGGSSPLPPLPGVTCVLGCTIWPPGQACQL